MAQTTSSSSSRSDSLRAMLDKGAKQADISSFLDGLSSSERLEQVLAVTGSGVGKLYEAVKGGPATTLAESFPASLTEGRTLILEGRNSLPTFSRFQKRFLRKGSEVIGYNHQTMSFVTGPGFFVATDADSTHPDELLFDYTLVPSFFPPDWPVYKPNDHLFSKLVYANMKDYCRHVARGVLVGSAFRNGKPENAFFTLTAS
jgi:hypothetical protein